MADDFSFYDISSLPYVMITDGVISQIGYSFINLTGYPGKELMHCKLIDVCREKLRMELEEKDLYTPNISKDIHMFTNNLDVRNITLSVKEAICDNERICVFAEKPYSRVEDRYPYLYQIYMDNIFGIALFSIPNFQLLIANERYLDFLSGPNNSLEKVIGKNIGEFFTGWPGSEFEIICNSAIENEKSRYIKGNELDWLKRGDVYWDLMLTPLKENGEVKYIAKCCFKASDIEGQCGRNDDYSSVLATLREPLLWEKEKLENTLKKKDEYFSFLSHEFKTPLTVINSAIQAMETVCADELSEKSRKYIGRIRQNVFRQLRLVNNILDIAKAESDKITINERNVDIVCLTGAIVDSVMLYAQEREIELLFSTDLPSKTISIDDEKYERIILNLLSNAIKYTPKGKRVYVSLYLKKDRVYIEVKDEGIGIPENKQKTVFEPFGQIENSLTRKSGGTGIGLTFVKFLLERMDGEIFLESEEGEGSTFTVSFPDKQTIHSSEGEAEYEITDSRLIYLADIEFSDLI
jgi:nitrogen-specific signal transduction histidine kinase